MPSYLRPLTFNERLYLAAESLAPPFALVYRLQGLGQLAAEEVRAVLPAWVAAFPALALQRKGRRWYTGGPLPRLQVQAGPLPEDLDAAVYREPLGAALAALDLFADGLLLRVRHRAMDAKGVQAALAGLFALLRGEACPPAVGFPVDSELRAQLAPPGLPPRGGYGFRWASLPGGDQPGWQTLSWSFSQAVPMPLAIAGSWLAGYLGEPCRFLVPVDLRRHKGVPAAAANLSLPLYLPVQPGQAPAQLQAQLLRALAAQAELAPDPAQAWGKGLPQSLLQGLLGWALRQARRRGRFPMSGFLSDNGFCSLEPLQAAGFQARDLLALPVFVPLAPFCFVALQHEGGSRLLLQIPAGLDAAALQAGLGEAFAQGLPPSPTPSPSPADPLVSELRPCWAQHVQRPPEAVKLDASFVDQGGDSLQWLSLLAEIAPRYVPSQSTAFIEAALDTGGRLTLAELATLIHRFES
jgi:hypothetical protein